MKTSNSNIYISLIIIKKVFSGDSSSQNEVHSIHKNDHQVYPERERENKFVIHLRILCKSKYLPS